MDKTFANTVEAPSLGVATQQRNNSSSSSQSTNKTITDADEQSSDWSRVRGGQSPSALWCSVSHFLGKWPAATSSAEGRPDRTHRSDRPTAAARPSTTPPVSQPRARSALAEEGDWRAVFGVSLLTFCPLLRGLFFFFCPTQRMGEP